MKEEKNTDPGAAGPSFNVTMRILSTVADTTWRMFAPSLAGLGLGFWLDRVFNIAPILMLVGVVLGAAISFFLIRAQLTKIRRQEVK